MVALETKASEIQQLGPIGSDLESIQAQMEEYRVRGAIPCMATHAIICSGPNTQEFDRSLQALVPRVEDVRSKGKAVYDSCVTSDHPCIADQLDKMNTLWRKVNSEGLGRKHSLESALLQLGQFHDAVAEFLHWVNSTTAGLNAQKQPGTTVETTEAHLKELEVEVQSEVVEESIYVFPLLFPPPSIFSFTLILLLLYTLSHLPSSTHFSPSPLHSPSSHPPPQTLEMTISSREPGMLSLQTAGKAFAASSSDSVEKDLEDLSSRCAFLYGCHGGFVYYFCPGGMLSSL